MAQKAIDIIKGLTAEPEVGEFYLGVVRRLADFGCFVEILPGTDGLVHVSELDTKRVERVIDICKEGDEMLVKVIGIDRASGKVRLSRRKALGETPDMAWASTSGRETTKRCGHPRWGQRMRSSGQGSRAANRGQRRWQECGGRMDRDVPIQKQRRPRR
jgi:polyribonucleotide nucleotidyltransferase